MNQNYDKLIAKLRELFELDKVDLDFGIYRIIGQRQQQISDFLDKRLKAVVQEELANNAAGDRTETQTELEKLEQTLRDAGVDPATSSKVQDLQAKLAVTSSSQQLENDIYHHLYSFFSRYYEEGDFISQRRVSRNEKYAIPYNGEEVKLHWANADQYYIKTAENFRNYRFKLADDRAVEFRLRDADTARDNTKGDKRFFELAVDENGTPDIAEVQGEQGTELHIGFHYQPQPKKQQDINGDEKQTSRDLLNSKAHQQLWEAMPESWHDAIFAPAKTEKQPDRTLLAKQLNDYTAKNSFDYFIHKDLGGFLRRELDFYIKNEVLFLDDIETAPVTKVEDALNSIRAIRRVASKVIAFLAQLEDFQKKLWLKKKFVVSCHYGFTLDKLEDDEALLEEVCNNEAQRAEWVKLFALDLEQFDTERRHSRESGNPLAWVEKPEYRYLVGDTQFFGADFRYGLLANFDDLDEQTDGVLFHSENFQALNLMQAKYRERVKCIYIDPPYNTDVSMIPYKNDYRHSSWGTLMRDRAALLWHLNEQAGAFFLSIDKAERTNLEHMVNSVYDPSNRVEELIWIQNTNDGRSPTYSTNHEYVLAYAKDKAKVEAEFNMFREPKPGYDEVMELVRKMNPAYPKLKDVESAIAELYAAHKVEYREQVEAQGFDWEQEKKNDPWKGIFNYKFVEYRDSSGRYVEYIDAQKMGAKLSVFRESDWTIMSSDSKQSGTTKDPEHKNFRYYEPIHPITGKPCKPSSRGWKGTQFIDPEYPERNSLESLMADHRIAFGPDENKVPQQKRFLHEVSSNVSKSVFVDYSDGEKETTALFGRSGMFLAPKHTQFVSRFIAQTTNSNSMVLDCFGGSGSTGGAVVRMNRADGGKRKFVLAEMGEYFNRILKPRIQKQVYADTWHKGTPKSEDGISHLFKTLKLESYEDTQNNLQLSQPQGQGELLQQHPEVAEDYLLHYMLDIESADSLLNLSAFSRPFDYQLQIAGDTAGEMKPETVDLVETFNFLIGLNVQTVHRERFALVDGAAKQSADGDVFVTLEGTLPNGSKTLVIWRDLPGWDDEDAANHKTQHNTLLDAVLEKWRINSREQEFDVIYVNGDNNLPNVRREEDHWKVMLIEEEFHRLMFENTEASAA